MEANGDAQLEGGAGRGALKPAPAPGAEAGWGPREPPMDGVATAVAADEEKDGPALAAPAVLPPPPPPPTPPWLPNIDGCSASCVPLAAPRAVAAVVAELSLLLSRCLAGLTHLDSSVALIAGGAGGGWVAGAGAGGAKGWERSSNRRPPMQHMVRLR